MKTKNNVQKTILRSVAVVVSFVLISFTVSGQDFWKELLANSSFNKIALAMVGTSNETSDSKSTTANFNLILLENETEPALEMEDWMHDDNYFGIAEIQITEESEIGLEIEEWMLDENLFQVKENAESPLELETWMTSEKIWEI